MSRLLKRETCIRHHHLVAAVECYAEPTAGGPHRPTRGPIQFCPFIVEGRSPERPSSATERKKSPTAAATERCQASDCQVEPTDPPSGSRYDVNRHRLSIVFDI